MIRDVACGFPCMRNRQRSRDHDRGSREKSASTNCATHDRRSPIPSLKFPTRDRMSKVNVAYSFPQAPRWPSAASGIRP
jgi:hypothetical protein